MSSNHIGRFVYSFDFIYRRMSTHDSLPKWSSSSRRIKDRRLYVDNDSLMKVLGTTVDVESEDRMLVSNLFDRKGNLHGSK